MPTTKKAQSTSKRPENNKETKPNSSKPKKTHEAKVALSKAETEQKIVQVEVSPEAEMQTEIIESTNAEKSEKNTDEQKVEKTSKKHHKSDLESAKTHHKLVHHWFVWWPRAVSFLLISSVIMTAVAYSLTYTPQYAYYGFYQAVKSRELSRVAEYVDFYKLAENVLDDQQVFFAGSNNVDALKFSIKAEIEYTFNEYLKDDSLLNLLPVKVDSWSDIYAKSTNDAIKAKELRKFKIDLSSATKDSVPGIKGYMTFVFELRSSWKLVRFERNDQLEVEKQKLQQQQNQTR